MQIHLDKIWLHTDNYEATFVEQTNPSHDRLSYGWFLYPMDEERVIGWSWRERVTLEGDTELIETRRFELLFRKGAAPSFEVTQIVLPVPPQVDGSIHVTAGEPTYETSGKSHYVLDKAKKSWRKLAVIPGVRGAKAWAKHSSGATAGWYEPMQIPFLAHEAS